MTPAELSQRFLTFAEKECVPASPLYARLARGVAEDDDLLALAAHARPGQPVPNLLFAAVQYRLLLGEAPALARYYPSLAPEAPGRADPFPLFRDFCLSHRAVLTALLATRLVQTNEVRRCACLLPAFGLVQALAGGRPLALIEVGASAGLNLLWDRYAYDIGGQKWGEAQAEVRLHCALRGVARPALPTAPVAVVLRLGLDLEPIEAADPDAARWLRALIWPEQTERAQRLEAALAVAARERPSLWRGDALTLLPDAFAQAPSEAALCVWHSFTLNQFTPDARREFTHRLAAEGARRPLFGLGLEWTPDGARLWLTTLESGDAQTTLLAACDPHGSWLEWMVPPQ